MNETVLTANCIGPFDHAQWLKVGDTQQMQFEDTVGPFHLSEEEKEYT